MINYISRKNNRLQCCSQELEPNASLSLPLKTLWRTHVILFLQNTLHSHVRHVSKYVWSLASHVHWIKDRRGNSGSLRIIIIFWVNTASLNASFSIGTHSRTHTPQCKSHTISQLTQLWHHHRRHQLTEVKRVLIWKYALRTCIASEWVADCRLLLLFWISL